MLHIDANKFIEKALKLIAEDKRNPLELGARKRPKIDFLNAISEVIILLLQNLFPISDQVYLINTIDKNFGVSDNTYNKFLSEYLTVEYERFRKNRIFALNVRKIRDAIVCYPASEQIQFSAVFGLYEGITFDDYKFFMENYYLKSAKEFFEIRPVNKYPKKNKELIFDGKCLKPEDVVTPAETFCDIVPLLSTTIGIDLTTSKVVKNEDIAPIPSIVPTTPLLIIPSFPPIAIFIDVAKV